MSEPAIRHTGLWPFSMFPPSWRSTIPATDDVARFKATVFDPLALAFIAAPKLSEAGWVGLELMGVQFRWDIVDADQNDVDSKTTSWVLANRDAIATDFEGRVASYTGMSVDPIAQQAMRESLAAYRMGHYLGVVRTLIPELERYGRMVILSDGSVPRNQREAVAALQDYLDNTPVSLFSPIERFSTYKVLSDELFAACYTVADAASLGHGPNRHAELHGLRSYGHLAGATKMIVTVDFLLCAVNAADSS